MRLLVFGAGAVGSLLGARLSRAPGVEVRLVARAGHARAIQQSGIELTGTVGGTFRVPATVEIPREFDADLVLLTVKAPDVERAGRELSAGYRTPRTVLALENGLGIERAFSRGLAEGGWADADASVLRGLSSLPATLEAPGKVRQAGSGELVLPGSERGGLVPTLVPLGVALNGVGIPFRVSTNIPREVWRKTLVNAAINPVTADHRVLNGRLLDEPWRGQAEALLREAQRAAALEGFSFSDAEADQELWRVVRATAENRSSMLQDVERGRETEIEAISGAIVEIGRKHAVDFPATQRALQRIQSKPRSAGTIARSSESV